MKAITACMFGLGIVLCSSAVAEWETIDTTGVPVPRHEAGLVDFNGLFYLMGGRRIEPVSVFDPKSSRWRNASKPPIEFHHFQPVIYDDKIYIVCAMTGGFPNETPLERVLIYDPVKDSWNWGHEIPEDRRRGGAGVVAVDRKIYVVGGIERGHQGGYVNWFDRYDPATGVWTKLPDAEHKRDHFQAAYLDGKIYAAGGRTTSYETGQLFDLVVPEVDVYDLKTGEWEELKRDLPTPRAGNSTLAVGYEVIVAGGESVQQQAHSEVEAWDTIEQRWRDYPSLNRGRHGTGLVLFNTYIYTCSGSGNQGGGPELQSTERLKLPVE